LVVALAMLAGGTSLLAQDDRARSALDNLVAAYPTALAGHDVRVLRWRDGTVMPISDSADSETPSERLRHASIIDQFRIPYPRGPLESHLPLTLIRAGSAIQPSSRRCMATAKKGEVSPHLVSLAWLPKTLANKTWGNSIRIASVNGVGREVVSLRYDALRISTRTPCYAVR
jgi:hypothetical protein